MRTGHVLILAVTMLVLGSAATLAATDGDVIHACVDKGSALIRSLDPGDECRKNERALSWNAAGPAGPSGPPGLSGVEIVRGEGRSLPTGVMRPSVTVSASCPEGKVALSGGATFETNAAFVVLGSPVVGDDSVPTGWSSFVTTASGGALPASSNIVATPFAICAAAE